MMRKLLLGFAAAALLLSAGIHENARAQGGVKMGPQRPYYLRLKEEADMRRQRPTEDIREVKSVPILDPLGRQIYAIVENRTLAKPQIDQRVNLLLQYMPEIKDEKEAYERRIGLEGRVLAEWTEAAALAVLAERMGYKASSQEVDQAMQELSTQSSQETSQAIQQVRLLGIPEADLRREMEDGIIIEKMLRDQVALIKDDDLMRVFAKDPDVFLEPTRVSAWHLVAVMVNSPTDDKVAAIKKAMNKLGKRFKKCKTKDEFVALQKEILADKELSGDMGIRLAYLDNVGASDNFDSDMAPLKQELLKQKPGSTSDIFSTGPRAKPTELHIVRVMERKEGHRGTFEEAKPQVQNFMIEKLKEMVYAGLQQKYDIRTSQTGLFDRKVIGIIRARPTPLPRATPRATPVATLNAPFLPGRQGGGGIIIEPPAVETVVGAKAETPKPGATLSPEAALAIKNQAGPDAIASLPGLPSPSRGALGDDLATSSVGRMGLDAYAGNPAAIQEAPLETEQPAPPVQRTATSRRRKSSRPPTNFNVAPPSVDQVLSKPQ